MSLLIKLLLILLFPLVLAYAALVGAINFIYTFLKEITDWWETIAKS